jgi:hypothetical protein
MAFYEACSINDDVYFELEHMDRQRKSKTNRKTKFKSNVCTYNKINQRLGSRYNYFLQMDLTCN